MDGLYIDGFNLTVDESNMTGESETILKRWDKDPFLTSGSNIAEGSGRMLAMRVGSNSGNIVFQNFYFLLFLLTNIRVSQSGVELWRS